VARFRPLRVVRVERESASVISLSFEDIDGNPLPAGLPGQFLVLKFIPAPDMPPVLRTYSMSGALGAGRYRVSIKQEVHGLGSTFLCNHVKVGDVLEISAPRGTFTLRRGEQPAVLLGAGIGATPLLAMLHELASTASHREVWWLYGTRNRNEHPFAEESRALFKGLRHGRGYVCYSRANPGDRLGQDYDAAGRLGLPVLNQLGAPRDPDFDLCGPPAFLSDLVSALRNWGVSPGRVFTELFAPGETVRPGISGDLLRPPHQPEGAAGPGPRVSFTRSGLTIAWCPDFQSLLELAETCDVPVKWSCRTGVCRSCECALIGGAVDYRPMPLEPPADGNVLICCSRPAQRHRIRPLVRNRGQVVSS
jgi:ferredoxin-NADP reductase